MVFRHVQLRCGRWQQGLPHSSGDRRRTPAPFAPGPWFHVPAARISAHNDAGSPRMGSATPAVAQTCQYWDVDGSSHPPAGAVVAHDAAACAAVVPTQSAPIGGTGEHVLAASHGTCRGLCVGLPMTSGDLPRNKEIVGLRGRPAPAAPWLHASRWAALHRRPPSVTIQLIDKT